MNFLPLLILLLCNFAAIGALPVLFFRGDGKYNLRWLATGAPFFIVPATLLLGSLGLIDPAMTYHPWIVPPGQAATVVLSTVSIALIALTVGAHRIPLALWHQDNDEPVELVTWGPYAAVRHPFYTSFILAFVAAALAFPHLLTTGCLLYGVSALSITARREERRLAESAFGADYRDYMARTGRFLPGTGR